jgi:hypothetical protein
MEFAILRACRDNSSSLVKYTFGGAEIQRFEIEPLYDSDKGHRDGGHDTAVAILRKPITNAEIYRVNIDFEGIERPISDEDLLNPAFNSIKVGRGYWGDGLDGAVFPSAGLRKMENRIDALGDGMTEWWLLSDDTKRIKPPMGTFAYDFDDPALEFDRTSLLNEFTDPPQGSLAVGDLEGGVGRGDSGGPMFQYVDGQPIIVGVTSSGLSSWWRDAPPHRLKPGAYGDIFFDTNIAQFSGFLYNVLEADAPPTLPLLVIALIAMSSIKAITGATPSPAHVKKKSRRPPAQIENDPGIQSQLNFPPV